MNRKHAKAAATQPHSKSNHGQDARATSNFKIFPFYIYIKKTLLFKIFRINGISPPLVATLFHLKDVFDFRINSE